MGDIASVYSIGGTLAYPEMKTIDDIDNAVTSLYFTSGALGAMGRLYIDDISAALVAPIPLSGDFAPKYWELKAHSRLDIYARLRFWL